MLYKILTVAVMSSFEIYVAIATGMAFGLSPFTICIATIVGGILGVFITVFLGEKIRTLILKYTKPKTAEELNGKKNKFLETLWEKYGVVGVGFVGTFFVGAPGSIGVGMGLGIQAKSLTKWALAAVILRSIIFSYFFDFVKNLF